MNKLIFVPIPLAEENPYSLIRRTVLFHGFPTVGQFNARCVGRRTFPSLALTQSSDLAIFLASEAGCYSSLVLSGFYQVVARAQKPHMIVSGIETPNAYLRLRSGAYCDGCFHEGWQRQIQDITFAEFCPYHLKKYLTRCPVCERELSWWHALDGKCQYCKVVLTCPSCSMEKCKPEQNLLNILRTKNQESFDKILRISRTLGYTPEKRNSAPDIFRREVTEAAFLIANDDQTAILEHLLSLHNLYPNVEKHWIAARFASINIPTLSEALKEFLEDKSPPNGTPSSTSPFLLTSKQVRIKLQAEGGKLINAKQICSSLAHKIRYYTTTDIGTLVQALKEYRSKGGGRLPVAREDMWTATKAAHELHVPQRTLHIYAKNGLLNVYFGKNMKKYFFPSDIENLLTRYEPPHYIAEKCGVSGMRVFKAMRDLDIQPAHNSELHWCNWLVNNEDGERIKRELAPKEKSKKLTFPLILPRFITDPKPTARYSPLSEAAKQLRLDKQTVHALIKGNYLKDACRGRKKIFILKSEINKFEKKHLTTATASEILKISLHCLADVLLSFDIQPLAFHKTQSRLAPIYKKSDILKIAQQLSKEDPAEKYNYLSITSAGKRLHTSEDTIRTLAGNRILAHRNGKLSIYVRPSDLDTLFEKHLTLSKLLRPLGFPPHMTPPLIEKLYKHTTTPFPGANKSEAYLYYSAEILCYFNSNSQLESDTLTNLKNAVTNQHCEETFSPLNCTALNVVLAKYRITYPDFYQTFSKLGFITIHKANNGSKYLTNNDFNRCSHILDLCLTCAMADNLIFNKSGTSQCLIRRQILEVEQPFSNLINRPLIHRKKLAQYLTLHPVGSYLKV